MIATTAAPMIYGALRFVFEDTHTVTQIDNAASAFGGTVILRDIMKLLNKNFLIKVNRGRLQLGLPACKTKACDDCRLKKMWRLLDKDNLKYCITHQEKTEGI